MNGKRKSEETDIKLKIKVLVKELNEASYAYYNSGTTLMSDHEFDRKLNELQQLEEESGFVLSNSPTVNVGAPVLDGILKVKHEHKPMLSLKKVYSAKEVLDFSQKNIVVAMPKLDGLSIRLIYEDGVLTHGETRGNGIEGSDVSAHVKLIENVPIHINKTGLYVVDGEAVILNNDFEEINKRLIGDSKFKNSRNLAAGTITSYDTSVVRERKIKFILWDVIVGASFEHFEEKMNEAKTLGFNIAPVHTVENSIESVTTIISYITEYCDNNNIPIDGVVFKFIDTVYGASLGRTEKYFRDAVAYKPANENYLTTVIDIEWTMGKTGVLTPTIVTEPIEIDGTEVNRASVHNVTIFKQFGFSKGCTCQIYKANMIIPQCYSVDDVTEEPFAIPNTCPYCGSTTEIIKENDSEVLRCTNEECSGKTLGLLSHFVSKNAMNIDGMSEATLQFLLKKGWVKTFEDIYHLEKYKHEWEHSAGFGKKSVEKMLTAIKESKYTSLDRFLYALSIPLIGLSASRDISKFCDQDIEKFCEMVVNNKLGQLCSISGFGDKMLSSLYNWCEKNWIMFLQLKSNMKFQTGSKDRENENNVLKGNTFAITGEVTHFKNREALKQKIEEAGGKVTGTVSKNTFALICNDKESNSGKSKKAKELGVQVITEKEFLKMIGVE